MIVWAVDLDSGTLVTIRNYKQIQCVTKWVFFKGQLISSKNQTKSNKIELVCSFFGRNVGLKKSFQIYVSDL